MSPSVYLAVLALNLRDVEIIYVAVLPPVRSDFGAPNDLLIHLY